MFNKSDITRDAFMLKGGFAKCGYDWWWHSFTGIEEESGEEKGFFIEFFTCNPAFGGDEPVFGQLEKNKAANIKPSYVMVKVGAWGEDATQLHRFFGWNKVELQKEAPFSVKCDDCYLDEKTTYGKVKLSSEEVNNHPEYMCDSGEMSWNLSISKKVAFNVGYGASELLRDTEAFEMFWHAEGMKTAIQAK